MTAPVTMSRRTWLARLERELPGWKVWFAGPGTAAPAGWYAVPAPAHTPRTDIYLWPYRVGPYPTPQALREAARGEYGDGDVCPPCGVDWRRCGHRERKRRNRST